MYRRFAQLVLALILLLVPVHALASEQGTHIDTEVPGTHTIALSVGEGGRAMVEGKGYVGLSRIVVPRHASLVVYVVPEEEWAIDRVLLDGVDVTGRLRDGSLGIDRVSADGTLSVAFRSLAPTPPPTPSPTPSGGGDGSSAAGGSIGSLTQTGDSTSIMLIDALATCSVALVCLLLAYAVRRYQPATQEKVEHMGINKATHVLWGRVHHEPKA